MVTRAAEQQLTAAADGSHLKGAMIALIPTKEDATRLAIEGGEAAEELHLTLYFLGDDGTVFGEEIQRSLIQRVAEVLPHYVSGPVAAKVFGSAHWNGNSDSPSWVWSVGDDPDTPRTLGMLHGAICMALEESLNEGIDHPDLPEQHTPWAPHICAAYSDELDLIIALEERLGPVTFDRVRLAFAGDQTDIPLGETVTAAASLLRRNPTDLEIASRVDFADMDRAWHRAVDSMVEAWAEIQTVQREQITAAVQDAVDADSLDQLNQLTVSTTSAANLLYGRMQEFARSSGRAQQREAEEQGIEVPEWSLGDEALTAASIRDRLRQIASATSQVLSTDMVQSAIGQTMRLFGSGTGEQIAAQVNDHLLGLSDARVVEQVGAAMTSAQNEGRMAVLAVAPPAEYVASEALDSNSCQPCRQIDGTQYTNLIDARAAYPSGGFTGCLGGSRCRGTLVTVWPTENSVGASGVIMTADASTMQIDPEGGTMPYAVVQDHAACAADTPWAVVKEADGSLMGCHGSEAEAEAQQAALYAEEGNPGAADEDPEMAGETAPWRGPLVIEGKETGDGREFSPGALTWAEHMVLRWNKEDSHGGNPHTVAVNVGRIDRAWREGDLIMGEGVLNLAIPDGRTVHQMIRDGFIRGISIDADSISNADVEFVWPDDVNNGMEEEGDLFEMLFAEPEKAIYHGGRIRAATLVDIPAFVEAYVELLDDAGAVVAGGQRLSPDDFQALRTEQFGVVSTHNTATSDAAWNGSVNEKRLPSPLTVAQARDAYAWYDSTAVTDGEMPKSAAKFLHHDINADGSIGPANLAACSATIGALHGARGNFPDIPESDRRGVYNHVAAHLRDADMEPEPFHLLPAMSAAAGDVWQPPAAWFADPQLSLPTGITITDDGRIYGHAAQWGSCHIGQEGVCVQPPHEDEHPYYRTGEVKCDDGSRVAVGQITVGTGHAPLHLGASPAAEHYDNTGCAVADVAVGNDRHGIWVAGAVRPNADPLRVYELQASGQVSGDWRRIGGQLRMVGLLAVNVPGFPVPKMRARVASGQPQALVAAGRPTVAWGLSREDSERHAVRIVMSMLRSRVHRGGE